jgi:hypothetical protein
MTALSPGQSPPPVSMPIRLFMEAPELLLAMFTSIKLILRY